MPSSFLPNWELEHNGRSTEKLAPVVHLAYKDVMAQLAFSTQSQPEALRFARAAS